MGWFGFWIFLSVVFACDCWLFSQGYNTLLGSHSTPEEKEIQKAKIERLKSGW